MIGQHFACLGGCNLHNFIVSRYERLDIWLDLIFELLPKHPMAAATGIWSGIFLQVQFEKEF